MSQLTEIVKTFYESDNALFSNLADDVEWHETEGLPYGGVYHSKEAVIEGVFSHIMVDWRDFAARAEAISEVGKNQVLTIGRYSGVFKSTGKSLSAAFAHLYTFEGGKVVRFQQFGDSAMFIEAMGPTTAA